MVLRHKGDMVNIIYEESANSHAGATAPRSRERDEDLRNLGGKRKKRISRLHTLV